MSGESVEQTKVLHWVRIQENVWVVKYPGGIYGQKGIPDLILCVNGRFVGIEMKRKTGGKVSLLQERERKKILKSGGICEFCKGFREAKTLIQEVLDGKRV